MNHLPNSQNIKNIILSAAKNLLTICKKSVKAAIIFYNLISAMNISVF